MKTIQLTDEQWQRFSNIGDITGFTADEEIYEEGYELIHEIYKSNK